MHDIWLWRAWGNVWQVGTGEDYIIWLVMNSIMTLSLLVLTAIVIVPVALYELFHLSKAEAAQAATAQQRGVEAWRLGPCPRCGNEQMRDGRRCVRCGF